MKLAGPRRLILVMQHRLVERRQLLIRLRGKQVIRLIILRRQRTTQLQRMKRAELQPIIPVMQHQPVKLRRQRLTHKRVIQQIIRRLRHIRQRIIQLRQPLSQRLQRKQLRLVKLLRQRIRPIGIQVNRLIIPLLQCIQLHIILAALRRGVLRLHLELRRRMIQRQPLTQQQLMTRAKLQLQLTIQL